MGRRDRRHSPRRGQVPAPGTPLVPDARAATPAPGARALIPRGLRGRRTAAIVAAAAVLSLAGTLLVLRARRSTGPGDAPPPPPPAAARVEPEPLVDPRDIPFPRDLPPPAAETLERAIATHLEALEAYYRTRNKEDGNSKALLALKLYSEAGAMRPELGQLHHDLLVRWYEAGQAGRAREEAQRWLDLFPESPAHLETLAKMEYSRGALARAADLLTRAAVLRPRSIPLWRRLAEVHSGQGMKEKSLEASRESLRLAGWPPGAPLPPSFWSHPEGEDTLRAAVKVHHRFYDYEALLPLAEALLSRFPGDSMGLIASGVARRQMGDYARAEELLSKVVDDAANGDEVRYELSISILKQGRAAQAAEVAGRLLRRSPHMSRGYFQLGQCLARLGRDAEAESMFQMSRRLAPSERELLREVELRGAGKPAEARRARAKALELRGQLREAEEVLRAASVESVAGRIYLIAFLVEALRGREAQVELEAAARQLGESHPDVRGWRGRLLQLQGDPRGAAAVLEPLAGSALPRNPWPAALGTVYLEDLGDARAAARWFERALSDPPQPEELARLAVALLEAGEPDRARDLLRGVNPREPDWEEAVRVPLALALFRATPSEPAPAAELLAGAPPGARSGRLYRLARAEELARGGKAGEAEVERQEARRLEELEARWRALRARIVSLPGPESCAPLLEAAGLREGLGDRTGALRLARLAASACPDSPPPHRALARLLGEPGEVFYRLQALEAWLRSSPADTEARWLLEAAERAIRGP